jgi:hypothetical protein
VGKNACSGIVLSIVHFPESFVFSFDIMYKYDLIRFFDWLRGSGLGLGSSILNEELK